MSGSGSFGSRHDEREHSRVVRLQRLFGEYLDRLNAGEVLERDEITEAHPDLADELFEQLQEFEALRGEEAEFNTSDVHLGILGDYTLRRQLGRGGMGVVYEAWEGSMARAVALKVLPTGAAADEKTFQRFMREARTAGMLSHQNVVSVYGVGIKERTPYYAMEYVEGETLAQILRTLKEAEPDAETAFGKKDQVGYFAKLADVFADVADGLQHAHSKGVIHRDVKPSNLILDAEGRLRILDFGLARLEGQESLTISGDVVGTPAYMSPEQAKSRKISVDHRTDIYSLGATLYELLTWQPPFRGKDHAETLSQIIERDPRPPLQLNPRVPEDLETIVLKCLRKETGDRYGTAEALGQDLRRFVRGDAIEARPPSSFEVFSRRFHRHRWHLLQGTIVLCLIAVLTVLGLERHDANRTRRAGEYERGILQSVAQLHTIELSLLPLGGDGLDVLDPSEIQGVDSVVRRLEGTLEDLTALEQMIPERPAAGYYRARVLRLLGKREEALIEARRTLSLHPRFVAARLLANSLETMLGGGTGAIDSPLDSVSALPAWAKAWEEGFEAIRHARWDEARAAFNGILEADVDPFLGARLQLLLARGEVLIGLNDVRAVEPLVTVTALWPNIPESRFLLGKAFQASGHTDVAEAVFEKLLETSSDREAVAQLVLGFYHLSYHSMAASLQPERWEKWIERIDDPAERERARALFHLRLGELDRAEASAELALRLDGEDPRNYHTLSLMTYRSHRTAEALDTVQAGLRKDPKNFELRALAGLLYFRSGRYREARDVLTHLLEDRPYYASGHHRLALNLFRLGEVVRSLKAFDRAIQLLPKNALFHGDKSWALFCSGQLDQAFASSSRAHDLEPQWSPGAGGCANVLERRGKLEDALEWSQRGAAVPMPNVGTIFHHARLLELNARPEDAFYEFTRILREKSAALGDPWTSSLLHYRLCSLLRRREPVVRRRPELAEFVKRLESATDEAQTGHHAPNLLALVRMRLFDETPNELRGILERAIAERQERQRSPHPELVATLAEISHREGRMDEALGLLDLALELPHVSSFVADLREEFGSRGVTNGGAEDGPTLGIVEEAYQRWRESQAESGKADLEWIRRELNSSGVARINCGGRDCTTVDGKATWAADRLFHGGWPYGVFELSRLNDLWRWTQDGTYRRGRGFVGRMQGGPDSSLYRTHRWFQKHDHEQGYRLTVENGEYMLTLHFAELWYQAKGVRVFDVVVEGELELAKLDAFAEGGFATPFVRLVKNVRVSDAVLDVVFRPHVGFPFVSAIEIVRVGRDS